MDDQEVYSAPRPLLFTPARAKTAEYHSGENSYR